MSRPKVQVSADPRYMPKNVRDRPEGWDSDQWATPWPMVRDLEREFGFFDLDPCAQPDTAKAPKFFTPVDDGLGLPWFGKVFMNPPYSAPGQWCKKAHEEVSSGRCELVVALIPASTDTRWFHEWVKDRAEIRFVRGRVRFLGWEGTPIPAPKAPSIIAIYRRPAPGELAARDAGTLLHGAESAETKHTAKQDDKVAKIEGRGSGDIEG